MNEKKLLTAVVELATAALVIYAQSPDARAQFYLRACRVSMWTAEKFGKLAMLMELKYRNEVSP
jgi:hypothetical protein